MKGWSDERFKEEWVHLRNKVKTLKKDIDHIIKVVLKLYDDKFQEMNPNSTKFPLETTEVYKLFYGRD